MLFNFLKYRVKIVFSFCFERIWEVEWEFIFFDINTAKKKLILYFKMAPTRCLEDSKYLNYNFQNNIFLHFLNFFYDKVLN